MENWFWLVRAILLHHHILLKQVYHYSETYTCNLHRKDYMFLARKKFYFSAVLLRKISHRKLNFDFACHLKIKTASSGMKSLRKVRGRKVSRPHWRTKKPTFGYYEGESDPGISSTEEIVKFLSLKYNETQMYIS